MVYVNKTLHSSFEDGHLKILGGTSVLLRLFVCFLLREKADSLILSSALTETPQREYGLICLSKPL